MSLRLLLDEDSQAKYLVNLLRVAGHDVTTIDAAGLGSRSDLIVLDYARQQGQVLLTRNCYDFQELHHFSPVIQGFWRSIKIQTHLINMSYSAIVKAIANLETLSYVLENQFIILNQWNY